MEGGMDIYVLSRKQWLDFEIMVRTRTAPDNHLDEGDEVREQLVRSWDVDNHFLPEFKQQIYEVVNRFMAYEATIDAAREMVEPQLAINPQLSPDPTGGFSFPDTAGFAEEAIVSETVQVLRAERIEIHELLSPGDPNTLPPIDQLLDVMDYTTGPDGEEVLELSRRWLQDESERYKARLAELGGELQRQQNALLKLQQRNRGFSAQWVGGWVLGEGAYGWAGAWVKRNVQNRIVDRVVIKDATSSREPGRDWWNEHRKDNWGKDPRDPHGRDILPNEILAMYSLRGQMGADTVVQIRNSRLIPEQQRMLLYLEYCPHGDLGVFIDWYNEAISGFTTGEEFRQFNQDRAQFQHPWLPEAFLWSVFESLATSAVLLEHGELGPNPIRQWDPIYHLDYKASNVLLGSESTERYKGYPLAKLTDFGLCWIPGRHHTLQPHEQYGARGTYYNAAPEQIEHIFKGEEEQRIVDAKVNVWGVGIVMWSLIEHEEGDHRLDFEARDDGPVNVHDDQFSEPRFRGPATARYSKALLDLIAATTQYLPEHRPTARELLAQIQRSTNGAGGNDYAQGMRSEAKDSQKWQDADLDVSDFLYDDRFRLRSKVPSRAKGDGLVPRGMDIETFRMPKPGAQAEESEDEEIVGGGPWPGLRPRVTIRIPPRRPVVRVPRTCTHDSATHDKIYCLHKCCKRGGSEYVRRGSSALVAEAADLRRRRPSQALRDKKQRLGAARATAVGAAAAPAAAPGLRRNPGRQARRR